MTTANIRIIRETTITSASAPGSQTRMVAITYQFGPRPPQVVLIPEADLADRVWKNANPTAGAVPPEIQEQGDEARRRVILAKLGQEPTDEGRTI